MDARRQPLRQRRRLGLLQPFVKTNEVALSIEFDAPYHVRDDMGDEIEE